MTGSLGSGRIKDIMMSVASRGDFSDWVFVVVDGGGTVPTAARENMFLVPQRWEASPFYSLADAIVTRAGASTLSEAAVMEIPTVVIPWGNSADGHQAKNAAEAAKRQGVRVWNEDTDDVDDLACKIRDICFLTAASGSGANKKMYNATDDACEKLWGFVIRALERRSSLKGDDMK
jgi:UDP-N-acetylglucosamine--N-acetylmuramyl-(pentapeptide) pyrophosphoryl-undecaprenol N-acetylglucosamine transferase